MIQQARELESDLTYWIDYVGIGILETLQKTKNRLMSLQFSSVNSKIVLTQKQESLLRFLKSRGRVKSPEIEQTFSISRARVGQLIKPLVDGGLILREGQSRATTYRLA